MTVSKKSPTRLRSARRLLTTTSAEVEYFCRGCKGHYGRAVPLAALRELACRCGSQDLLVYSLSADNEAPLRAS